MPSGGGPRDSGGQWSDWSSLGGLITSPPAAVSADPGAVTVFARGIDNALWVSNDGGGGVRGGPASAASFDETAR